MSLYATGKTVPELDETSSISGSGLLIVHDGTGLKKIVIDNIRSTIVNEEATRATNAEAELQTALDAVIERIAALEAKST